MPEGPEFEHLDSYERLRLQELMVAIDAAHNNTGKLEGHQGAELVALTREFRNADGEREQLTPSNHLQRFSLDLANIKKTDTFGFYDILDNLRRKLELTPLIFPHERTSLLELYRAVDTRVVGDGLDAHELDSLSTGVIKIGEYLRAKMDGMDDDPNVSEEEWLEYVVVFVSGVFFRVADRCLLWTFRGRRHTQPLQHVPAVGRVVGA